MMTVVMEVNEPSIALQAKFKRLAACSKVEVASRRGPARLGNDACNSIQFEHCVSVTEQLSRCLQSHLLSRNTS